MGGDGSVAAYQSAMGEFLFSIIFYVTGYFWTQTVHAQDFGPAVAFVVLVAVLVLVLLL